MKTFPNKTIDLFIEQGTTFSQAFKVENASGSSFYAGIRKTVADQAFIDFNISMDSVNSIITISLQAPATLNLKYNKTYIYSLMQKTLSGVISIVAEGNVIVDPGTAFKTGV